MPASSSSDAKAKLRVLTRNMGELGRLGIAVRDPFVELPVDT